MQPERESKYRREIKYQWLKSQKCRPGDGQARTDFWDTHKDAPRGFGVRVTAAGKRTFILRYRNAEGKQRRMTVGEFPALTLDEARKRARKLAVQIDDGRDPAAEKKAQRKAAKTAPTFKAVAERFLRQHAAKRKPATEREYKRIVETELHPRWGERKAGDVTRRDVIELLDEIGVERDAPFLANRTRAVISVLFRWALERDLVLASPAAVLPRRHREKSRERVLSDSEIRRFWEALDKERPVMAGLFRFLLLTGQRSSETRRARWANIESDVWTLPAELTKNGREHRVPLWPQAVAVLDALREETGKSAYVFDSNRGEGPIRWLSHAAARIRDRAKIDDFRPHDLRRTCGTGMARLGVGRTTLQKILNHSDGSSVTAIYDRYSRWPEQVEAMRLWGEHVEQITSEEPEEAIATKTAGSKK